MSGSDNRTVALVTTTIYVPHCLEGYLLNAEQYGHLHRLSVIVVGDHKTPPETGPFLRTLADRFGISIKYMDVADQEALLRKWPTFDITVRYHCIQRRNVGYLQAAMDGQDVIISVDDDNFLEGGDYIGTHLVAGTDVEAPVLSHPGGWWNVAERLTCDPVRRFYHRGFPKSRQDFSTGGHTTARRTVHISVNAGLWLQNPDVDATANIEEPLNVVRMEPLHDDRRTALASGCWCPFNSQNTAFERKVLPAMYLVVMLDFVRGYRIGRMDDIWMSYFVRAIGDTMGDHVLYGPPLSIQKRNPHNFVKDLAEELPGYILTEKIVNYLRDFHPTEQTYGDAYLHLIHFLKEKSAADRELDVSEREYLRGMTLGMASWHTTLRDVMGSEC